MAKKRELTVEEKRRKLKFEAVREEMEKEGYTSRELLIGIVQANTLGLLSTIPFVAVLLVLFMKRIGLFEKNSSYDFEPINTLLFLGILIGLIILHEGIHGLTWGIFARDHFKSIAFGMIWVALTPYCTCMAPLKKGQYLIGCAMPTLLLGFGLGAAAVITGNLMLCILSAVMLVGGGGDFLIMLKLLFYKSEKKDRVYVDHPYECGLVVFER